MSTFFWKIFHLLPSINLPYIVMWVSCELPDRYSRSDVFWIQTDKQRILINEKIRYIVKIIKFLFNLETYWYLKRKIWSEPANGIVIVDVKGFVETYLVDLMCTINTFANREGIFFTENLQRFSTVTVTMIFQRPWKYANLGKV